MLHNSTELNGDSMIETGFWSLRLAHLEHTDKLIVLDSIC